MTDVIHLHYISAVPKPKPRNAVFTLRLTRDEREALKRVARKHGKTRADLVRSLILQEIGRAA